MRVRRFLGSSLVLPIILACTAGPVWASPPTAYPQPEAVGRLATRASDFVDSIGVNVHLHYTDTVYKHFDDVIKPRLLELGVKNLRDGAYTYAGASADSFYYRRMRELAATGIRFDLITAMRTPWGEPTQLNMLPSVYQWSGRSVRSFEGVNEPDAQGVTNWIAQARAAQQDLAATVRGSQDLRGVKVIGPSLTKPESAIALGELSNFLDYGNMHNYYSDRAPETAGWGPNGYGSLPWNFQFMVSPVAPSKPAISTETGYYNAPTSDSGVSEETAAAYIPRLLLGSFEAGVERTYLYELIDQRNDPKDREANFGLLDATGKPKPAFESLRNLISILADSGPAFDPGRLAYRLEAGAKDVNSSLFQKSDGSFYLAVWRPTSSWDVKTDRPTSVATEPVTVTAPAGFIVDDMNVFNADGSTTTFPSTQASATVDIGSRLGIFKIVPATPMVTPPSSQPAPANPLALRAIPGRGTVELEWAPMRGAAVAGYTITQTPGPATYRMGPQAHLWRVKGLRNGTRYTFRIYANLQSGGRSATAVFPTATPADAPVVAPPTVKRAGRRSVAVAWRPAQASGSPILAYRLTVRSRVIILSPSRLAARVPGLAHRKTRIGISASNSIGWGKTSWSRPIRTG